MSEELEQPIIPSVRPILNPNGTIFGPTLDGTRVMPSDPLWFFKDSLEPFTLPKFVVKIPEPWVKEGEEPPKDNPPENYGSDLITIKNEEIMAYTFYVDSVPWDDTDMWRSGATQEEKNACYASMDKSGDGSKEKPWRNVCYALDKLNCVLEQQVYGRWTVGDNTLYGPRYRCPCMHIRLVLTGTINYTVCRFTESSRLASFNDGDNKPIVIFDGSSTKIEVERSVEYFLSSYGIYACYNSYFYNCTVTTTASDSVDYSTNYYGIYSCDNSYFYNCTMTITCTAISTSSYGDCNIYGIFNCDNSYFYNCTVTSFSLSDNYPADIISYGIYNCSDSYFYNCSVTSTATAYATDNDSYGILDCNNSYFYNCTVTATSTSINSYGIFDCNNSYFYNCTVTITATNSVEYFPNSFSISGCSNSYFYNCTVTTTAISTDYNCDDSYGIYNCRDSYFYNCTMTITCTAISTAHSPDGYYSYSVSIFDCYNSYFYNCTVTATAISTDYYYYAYAYGIYSCDNSYFYNCTVTTTATAYTARSYGIYNCRDSYFYNCTIECTGEGYQYYYICSMSGHNVYFINTSYSRCSSNDNNTCWENGQYKGWCYCNCQLTYD